MPRKKGDSSSRDGETKGGARLPIRLLSMQIGKVPIAMDAGWGYDAPRHRLPLSFSNVIGEPGHTKTTHR